MRNNAQLMELTRFLSPFPFRRAILSVSHDPSRLVLYFSLDAKRHTRSTVGSKFLWRMGNSDLVCSRRQRFTFGCVLPLPADRTI